MITTIVSVINGPVLSDLGGRSSGSGKLWFVALELGSNLSRYVW